MILRFAFLFLIFSFVNCQIEEELNQILDEVQASNNTTNNSSLNLEPFEEDNSEITTTDVTNLAKEKNKFTLDPLGEPGKNTTCKFECVPFYQCKNGIINTSGETIIDIRINDGPCGNAFLTCCQSNQITSDKISTNPSSLPIPKGCGYRHPDGVGFTITGQKDNEAQFAEFPWVVSVIRNTDGSEVIARPTCGGALIHPRAVITAAHCVADKKDRWKIRAGEWDIIKIIEPYPHQEVSVESVTVHKDFYSGALFNDIAFLYLQNPVKITENVQTICLPPPNYQHKPNRCLSTGWGKDKFGHAGTYHVILKKTELPFVPRDVCQEDLRKTRLGRFFLLHQSFMCAGGERGKDACNGDGGSPLVCPLEGEEWRYYQAGIVAWGIGCGDENVPGVYVDVAKFRDWINERMVENELEMTYYDQNIGLEPRFK